MITISDSFFQNEEKISAVLHGAGREKTILPYDAFELWYVAHGTGFFSINNQEILVQEGEIFLIPPGIEHYFRSPEDPSSLRLELYYCRFIPDVIDVIFSDCGNISKIAATLSLENPVKDYDISSYIMISDTSDKIIRNLFIQLIHEFTCRTKGYNHMLKAYLLQLLILVFRKYEEELTGNKTGIQANNHPIVTNIIKYIHCNLQNEITLEELSDKHYISVSYLAKIFKQHTGVTIFAYIQHLRIEKACDILKNTERTIEKIARQVGYGSHRYFQKIFKNKIGMTMYEYRKKYRNNSK